MSSYRGYIIQWSSTSRLQFDRFTFHICHFVADFPIVLHTFLWQKPRSQQDDSAQCRLSNADRLFGAYLTYEWLAISVQHQLWTNHVDLWCMKQTSRQALLLECQSDWSNGMTGGTMETHRIHPGRLVIWCCWVWCHWIPGTRRWRHRDDAAPLRWTPRLFVYQTIPNRTWAHQPRHHKWRLFRWHMDSACPGRICRMRYQRRSPTVMWPTVI